MKSLILGGAGFIGSNIAEYFYNMGTEVTVIDGLIDKTGGQKKNLEKLNGKIKIFFKKIEELENLDELLIETDLIIDCMAWTSHIEAIENPFFDLDLNCRSHLFLIEKLKKIKNKKVIFLSSLIVFGGNKNQVIVEETYPNPIDIQGIHKLTAEYYFKFYSKIYDFNIVILRFPNCFGKNQLIIGKDIGLVGSIIRDSLLDKEIEVYGRERTRQLIFVDDLVDIIWLIVQKDIKSFLQFNVSAYNIPVLHLTEKIVKITGKGKILLKEIPQKIDNIDQGTIFIDNSKLIKFVGRLNFTNIDEALTKTINYFKENLI